MKKFLFVSLMMMLAHVQGIHAEATDVSTMDNVVYSMPLTVGQGRQADLPFALKNSASIRGFEFNLYLPEGVTILEDDGDYVYSFNSSRLPKNDDHGISFSRHTDVSGAVYYKLLCSSLNDKMFTGNDGELFYLTIEVDESVDLGDYPVVIKGLLVGDYNGTQQNTATEIEGTLTIVDASQLRTILEETSTEMPAVETGVNVTVKRTIPANSWSTICLPFAISAQQMTTAFGEDVEVTLNEFMGCETTKNDAEEVTGIKVKFAAASEMEANHPYIIKVSAPVSEINVDNVDILAEEAPSVDRDEDRIKVGNKWYTIYNSFIGTNVANTLLENNTLFISGNKFYYSTGNTVMKAFRGYFSFIDVLSEVDNQNGANIALDFDTTDIKGINSGFASEEGAVYTVGGQLVGKDVKMEQLPKGVYIINGKKRVVK